MNGVDGIGSEVSGALQDAYLASYPSHRPAVFVVTTLRLVLSHTLLTSTLNMDCFASLVTL